MVQALVLGSYTIRMQKRVGFALAWNKEGLVAAGK
jgi:hypothetical protein